MDSVPGFFSAQAIMSSTIADGEEIVDAPCEFADATALREHL